MLDVQRWIEGPNKLKEELKEEEEVEVIGV